MENNTPFKEYNPDYFAQLKQYSMEEALKYTKKVNAPKQNTVYSTPWFRPDWTLKRFLPNWSFIEDDVEIIDPKTWEIVLPKLVNEKWEQVQFDFDTWKYIDPSAKAEKEAKANESKEAKELADKQTQANLAQVEQNEEVNADENLEEDKALPDEEDDSNDEALKQAKAIESANIKTLIARLSAEQIEDIKATMVAEDESNKFLNKSAIVKKAYQTGKIDLNYWL